VTRSDDPTLKPGSRRVPSRLLVVPRRRPPRQHRRRRPPYRPTGRIPPPSARTSSPPTGRTTWTFRDPRGRPRRARPRRGLRLSRVFGGEGRGGWRVARRTAAASINFGAINSTGFRRRGPVRRPTPCPTRGVGGAVRLRLLQRPAPAGADTSAVPPLPPASTWRTPGTGGQYPAFVTHGEGMGSILLEGLTLAGAGDIAPGATRSSGATVRVQGAGRLEDRRASGSTARKIVVDGLTVVGGHAGVTLDGAEKRAPEHAVHGEQPGGSRGYQAAITEGGRGNTIRFLYGRNGPGGTGLRRRHQPESAPDSKLRWYGNILLTTGTVVRAWFPGFRPEGVRRLVQLLRSRRPVSTTRFRGAGRPVLAGAMEGSGARFPARGRATRSSRTRRGANYSLFARLDRYRRGEAGCGTGRFRSPSISGGVPRLQGGGVRHGRL